MAEPDVDPLDGQEIIILNSMLTVLHPLAKAGDQGAIDRIIKILDLKRKYREDRSRPEV
jgi:hypothetical protein